MTEQSVAELVTQALEGDERAWRAIVDRYAPLLWSICRKFRLSDADAADVAQNVWLRLVEHLPQIREAAALPGWIQTTARRECIRVADTSRRATLPLTEDVTADERLTALDAELLAAERRAVLRDAMAQLPTHCQQLLAMIAARATSYLEVSARLGMPVGSIGPTRARCLSKLRDCPALAMLVVDQAQSTRRGARRA